MPLHHTLRLSAGTLAMAMAALPALADDPVTRISFSQAQAGSVGLGAARRFGTSPYYYVETVSSLLNDKNSDLVPLYLFEGKHFFSRGTSAGLHLLDEGPLTVDALVQYRFNRLETDVNEFYEGVSDREQTLDGGVEIGLGDFSLNWLNDLQSRHNGHEANLTYRFDWHKNRFHLSPYVSLVYQDQDLVDYYYGVTPEESRPDLPVYSPGSATFARAGINASIDIHNNFNVFLNWSLESLPEEITDSPLVERDGLSTLYLGLSYNFGNVFETREYAPADNELSGWSMRFHTGYTAEATFHKVHRADIRPSKDVDTYLAGVTLGRLLTDGERVDFWAKASLNRRLENDLQDNFNEYNFYVMAMGTGFSPWTKKELFRYGFGFGFSYADTVPIIEQVKQEERGRNTSHFLNYLEAQVDFPMRNFTSSRSLKNCYIGISLIHRSGIFASSDILGNVAGGSDVFAGHVECKK